MAMVLVGPDFQFPPSIFLDDNGDAITNEADRDDKGKSIAWIL